jgi:hypothetical protein
MESRCAARDGRCALEACLGSSSSGPLKSPAAIATFGSNVYFLLRNGTDIWVVSKAGGKAQRFVTLPDTQSHCDRAMGLWADERGLFWLVGWPRDQAIHFMPWPSRGAAK